jgi:polyisoprenoid-binding protein YceI
MKHLLVPSLFLLLGNSVSAQDRLTVDAEATKMIWTATKVTGAHTGGLTVKQGTVVANGGALVSAHVVMDMTSITCTDMQGTGAERLVGHLKSADFFDTDQHPSASFTSTKVEPIADALPGQPNYTITGDLTIKGITHPVTFACIVWRDGKALRAAANLTFDRTKYDIKYRSGTFFPEIGDKMIHDEVSLTFDLKAE